MEELCRDDRRCSVADDERDARLDDVPHARPDARQIHEHRLGAWASRVTARRWALSAMSSRSPRSRGLPGTR
jgi:hypothetical protein